MLLLLNPLAEAAINAYDTTLKNPSNTRVTYWGGKLLTHFEAALPYQVSVRTGGKPRDVIDFRRGAEAMIKTRAGL